MVTGRAVEEGDQEPISLEGGSIEAVNDFQYLGLLIATTGRMNSDVFFWCIKKDSFYG